MNKGIWVIPVIASVLILGTFGVVQDVYAPPPAKPEKIQVGPIKAVLNVLTAAHNRMDKINGIGGTPPDDSIPVLTSIKSECTAINAIADEMLARG